MAAVTSCENALYALQLLALIHAHGHAHTEGAKKISVTACHLGKL